MYIYLCLCLCLCIVYVCVHLWIPQCWSKDPIANDEVKLLQVRSGPVLQHAVALKTALTIVKALSDLEYIAHNINSSKTQNYLNSLSSHLLCDFGFLFQSQGH